MRVFLSGTSFDAEYGGPAHSVSRLAAALATAGARVGVWSADGSVAHSPLVPDAAGIERLTGTAEEAMRAFGAVDILHDNGMWRPHNHRLAQIAATRRIPRLVSTRGMLHPWALGHKRLKKRIAWWIYQRGDLTHAQCHHATAEAEAVLVRRLDLGVPVRVIPNGVDVPPIDAVTPPAPTRRALFIGRLYPVKGLPALIDAWAAVRPAGWSLHIAGPDEGGHRAELERAVRAQELESSVTFGGLLDSAAKRRELLAADLFVLPSQSESFGMAIGEALAHGVPVLTTTAAPWPVVEHDCGWRSEPSPQGLAAAIRRATSLDRATLRGMGARGRQLVSANYAWDRVAAEFLATYEQLLRRAA